MAFPLNSFIIPFWQRAKMSGQLRSAKFPCLLIDWCGKSRAPWLQLAGNGIPWCRGREELLGAFKERLVWVCSRSSSSALIFITLTPFAQLEERKNTLTTHLLWLSLGICFFSFLILYLDKEDPPVLSPVVLGCWAAFARHWLLEVLLACSISACPLATLRMTMGPLWKPCSVCFCHS